MVNVTGWVRWVFVEGCCLGCQEAFCKRLHHLHTEVKQGSPTGVRGPRENSAQGRTVLVSGPGGAKAAKGLC